MKQKMHRHIIVMGIVVAIQFALTLAADVAAGPYSMEKLIEQLEMSNSTNPSQINTVKRIDFDNSATENEGYNILLSDYVSKSIFDFGHDIGLNLLQARPDNKYEVFSPVSIVSALNLLLLGAKGNTFDELMSVLKYSSNPVFFQYPLKIHEEFSKLMKELSSDSGYFPSRRTLPWKENFFNSLSSHMYRKNFDERQAENGKFSIANGLFIQQGYTIRDSYINVAKSLYNCEIGSLDFFADPSGAARHINNWVNQQTRGLIQKIVGDVVAPETKAIIANSLYFKAEWYNEFLDGATGWKNFYPNGMLNQPITVEMMANAGRFPYYESAEMDLRIMGFPYKLNQSTMYIIIPNNSNKQNLIKLQSELTFDRLENMITRMEVKTAVVLLPKMRLTSQSNLRDILMRLGARSIFSPRVSDLSLIASSESELGVTSGRVMPGITSGRVERLTNNHARPLESESLHNQLIFSRVGDDSVPPQKRRKRDVTYKVQNNQSTCLKFKDFILNKRISKANLDKKKHSRKYRRNVADSNMILQELERMRNTNLENPGLFADDVLHKVNLIVNEQRTEAAAATAVTINRSGPQVTFRVEIPFLILIRHDTTKLPLFFGSVFEPVN